MKHTLHCGELQRMQENVILALEKFKNIKTYLTTKYIGGSNKKLIDRWVKHI